MRPYLHICSSLQVLWPPTAVWEIPTPPPPNPITLSMSHGHNNIYCFSTLIILLCRGFLAYLKCLKRYSYPAQCCWTWAVCLLIEPFLLLLGLIVWLAVSSASFLSIIYQLITAMSRAHIFIVTKAIIIQPSAVGLERYVCSLRHSYNLLLLLLFGSLWAA